MCLMLLLLGGQLHRLPAQHIRIQIKVQPKLALEDTREEDPAYLQLITTKMLSLILTDLGYFR
jgi:hypothetical protein